MNNGSDMPMLVDFKSHLSDRNLGRVKGLSDMRNSMLRRVNDMSVQWMWKDTRPKTTTFYQH